MRILYLLGIIYIGFTLASCAVTEQNCCTPPYHNNCNSCKKNPLRVTFYTNGQPKTKYKILGKEKVSKYNTGGIRKQEASIRDGMREIAAAMGGDAVIDIQHDDGTITGTVVAFEEEKDSEKG